MTTLKNLQSSRDAEEQLIRLLLRTWKFDFPSNEAAYAAAQYYLTYCTQRSSEAWAIYDEDEEIAAVLFGTLPDAAPLRFCSLDVLQSREQFIAMVGEGCFTKWHEEWLEDSEALRAQWRQAHRQNRDAWIDLLITNARCQGRGFGRELVRHFESLAKRPNNIDAIGLQTDTWCGWQFYEKLGYDRVLERTVVDQTGRPIGAYFIYAKSA